MEIKQFAGGKMHVCCCFKSSVHHVDIIQMKLIRSNFQVSSH